VLLQPTGDVENLLDILPGITDEDLQLGADPDS
jgi:hypothetical protein